MYRHVFAALTSSAIICVIAQAEAEPLSLQSEHQSRTVYRAAPAYVPPQPAAPHGSGQNAVRYASADPADSDVNLGGGFIEFLFNGGRGVAPRPPGTMMARGEPTALPQEVEPARQIDPKYLKQLVDYHGPETPGTIVIDTPQRFLYLVQENGKALRYGIGVGKPGFTWAGEKKVTAKKEWPDWVPPPEMLQRRPDLPHFMAGGPDNPLGARALYLGSSLYRIHGSNEPWTIGQAVSSGCIRMRNEDVIDLYGRVQVGSRVVVI